MPRGLLLVRWQLSIWCWKTIDVNSLRRSRIVFLIYLGVETFVERSILLVRPIFSIDDDETNLSNALWQKSMKSLFFNSFDYFSEWRTKKSLRRGLRTTVKFFSVFVSASTIKLSILRPSTEINKMDQVRPIQRLKLSVSQNESMDSCPSSKLFCISFAK